MLREHGPVLRLHDFEPELESFRAEVLRGLRQRPKELPCKFFYDAHGSHLFDQICELDEYYPTRTELAIMRQHGQELATCLGPQNLLIEYGSGSSTKTRLLLDVLQEPAAYVPIDISKAQLRRAAAQIARDYPGLEVLPVCADYTRGVKLPLLARLVARQIIYYPGSTIGNFHPWEAQRFLQGMAQVAGPGGGLVLGVDLKKDPRTLHHAYNDRHGITAAFNLNMLARINHELGANFQLDQFRHYAFFNPAHGRIEMHLISLRDQTVHLAGEEICFQLGESIWTESSYKYTPQAFAQLAGRAGWDVRAVWTDPDRRFSVQYLSVR